jgi:hypothetical protein
MDKNKIKIARGRQQGGGDMCEEKLTIFVFNPFYRFRSRSKPEPREVEEAKAPRKRPPPPRKRKLTEAAM